MIINISTRTDIVNYYSNWLFKRFEEGFVYTRNPFYPDNIYKFKLSPDVVDCVVFCSKNYAPVLPRFHEIYEKFNIFCHYTITAYGRDIEPNVPDIDESIETFIRLSKTVGCERVAWRYDPILLTPKYTTQKHLETFEYMAEKLTPYTSFCIFSFVEMYKKSASNMPEIVPFTQEDKLKLVKGLGAIGKKYGLKIQTCATEQDYTKYGINLSGCVTSEILSIANNINLKVLPHKGNRKNCHCIETRDIGAYDSCLNACKYCYANKTPQIAFKNIEKHNPDSPLLIGEVKDTDIIIEGRQESFIIQQQRLF